MRNAMLAGLLLALGSLLAFGCDAGFDDTQIAPTCTSDMGCPDGTVCVDGVRCAPIPDASIPVSPPLSRFLGPGARPRRPSNRGGGAGQRDAGAPIRDGSVPSPGGTCSGGLTLCGTLCVNPLTDAANCGGCGVACVGGQFCTQGFCCGGTEVVCGTQCTDLQTDPNNCGVCGFQCIVGLSCVQGQCTPPSPTPLPF